MHLPGSPGSSPICWGAMLTSSLVVLLLLCYFFAITVIVSWSSSVKYFIYSICFAFPWSFWIRLKHAFVFRPPVDTGGMFYGITAVISLSCSVHIFKTIWQMKRVFWANDILICVSYEFRRISLYANNWLGFFHCDNGRTQNSFVAARQKCTGSNQIYNTSNSNHVDFSNSLIL